MGKKIPQTWIPIDESEIDKKFSTILPIKGLKLLKEIDKLICQTGANRGYWGSHWYYSFNKKDTPNSTIGALSSILIDEKGSWTRQRSKNNNSFRITNIFKDSFEASNALEKILIINPSLKEHFIIDPKWSNKWILFIYSPLLNENEILNSFDIIIKINSRNNFKTNIIKEEKFEIKPSFSDELNLIKDEEKIKSELEPLLKEDRKKNIDLIFTKLLLVKYVPNKKEVTISTYERNVELSLFLKKKYGHTCQVCGIKIELPHSNRYIESHHILPLCEGGLDCLSNMISVCPNCHIKFQKGAIQWNFKKRILIDNLKGTTLNLKFNFHL